MKKFLPTNRNPCSSITRPGRQQVTNRQLIIVSLKPSTRFSRLSNVVEAPRSLSKLVEASRIVFEHSNYIPSPPIRLRIYPYLYIVIKGVVVLGCCCVVSGTLSGSLSIVDTDCFRSSYVSTHIIFWNPRRDLLKVSARPPCLSFFDFYAFAMSFYRL